MSCGKQNQTKMKKDIRCPLEYGLAIFGGKWKSRIICVLAAQAPLWYSVLRKEMGNITDAVLSSMLKELMTDGMVLRTSYDEIPPRVEYQRNRQPDQRAKKMSRDQPRLKSRIRFITMNCSE